jgi:hypothetical protein
MLVYSKKIVLFLEEIKSTIVSILQREIGFRVSGHRFYDKKERFSYPIKVVIFNDRTSLGYFDQNFFELGFHESTMYFSKEKLHNLIRHELAHYIAFINFGDSIEAHGNEFRDLCKSLGWSKEIYEAKTNPDPCDTPFIEESAILRKIQKLMALSSSSSKHEAELAMLKSRELLLKHNIENTYIGSEDLEKLFVKRVLNAKRLNSKIQAIGRILETFFVNIVYNQGSNGVELEILGERANIEIAEYVAKTLDHEFEALWEKARFALNLSGIIAKNSFFFGLAKGYCDKIGALKKEYPKETSNTLLIIEKKLSLGKDLVYPRLRSTKSSGKYCPTSGSAGEHAGKDLNINTAITSSSGSTKLIS